MDIAVDLPSLYEQVDLLPSLTGELLVLCTQEAINSCLALHRRLTEWRSIYYTTYDEDIRLVLAGRGSKQPISAKTIMAAHLSSLFWSLSVKVYSTLHDLDPRDHWLPSCSLSNICCRNIVKAIPIFLESAMGMFRIHLATFPLGAAVTHVATSRSEDLQTERGLLAGYLGRPEFASMQQLVRSLQPSNWEYVMSQHGD